MIKLGSMVKLNVPENERVHNANATVIHITDWGAHVATSSTATGFFRALNEEMIEIQQMNGTHDNGRKKERREYTGSICDHCGSAKMVRTGVCETCQDCGTTSGCS